MLRTTAGPRPSGRTPGPADGMQVSNPVVGSPRQESDLNGPSTLSALQKHQIYTQWIASGKPHYIICSECRKPNNLIPCESCCRSYHTSCLPTSDLPPQSVEFHCPTCSTGQLDSPSSTVDPSISPAASRARTPSVRDAARGIMSPPEPVRNSVRSTPTSQTVQGRSPTADDPMGPQPPFDPSILTRAREFLHTHGGFRDSQPFSADFLLELGSMMAELELHRERAQELAFENAHLRQDNANIRAYLDSNLATGRPVPSSGGDATLLARPSDPTGKSWDRIVADLI